MSNLKGVIIDAGHGGVDVGATSNGLYEKDLTLKISKYMYDVFTAFNVKTYLTRITDETLNPTARVNKAKSFLGTSSDVILLSNHINAGGGIGAEVIYSVRNKSILANDIINSFKDSNFKVRKAFTKVLSSNPKKDYYFILRDTANMESLIIEYAFIDNKDDINFLIDNYKEYVLDVVYSVLDYKNINHDYYKVKAGDTLYKIAKLFNISVDKLKLINNISSDNINVNDLILVNKNKYKVHKGDSLYKISKMFTVSVSELKRLNNLKSDLIQVNQLLIIK